MCGFHKAAQCLLFSTAFLSIAAAPLKVLKPNGSCLPGELVWVECNLCTCNPQGKPNQVCAAMWCQPVPTTSKPRSHQIADSIHYSVGVGNRRLEDTSGSRHRPQHIPRSDDSIRIKNVVNITEIISNNLTIEGTTISTTLSPHIIPRHIQE